MKTVKQLLDEKESFLDFKRRAEELSKKLRGADEGER
jgi:hypothetical protein